MEVEVGVEDEEDTTGVTETPAGNGDEPWLGLRGGGEGEEAGLSKQIIWGLTDPEEGGEKAGPPLLPPAGVSSPLVPLDEAVWERKDLQYTKNKHLTNKAAMKFMI